MKVTIDGKEIKNKTGMEIKLVTCDDCVEIHLEEKQQSKPRPEYLERDIVFRDIYDEGILYACIECFDTVDAQNITKKCEAIEAVKKYIHDNFGVFEPDWDNATEKKWEPHYNHHDDIFGVCDSNLLQGYSPFGYLKSEEDAKQLIKDCEKELIIIFEVEND